jgi:hypothetical protein
MVNLFPSGRKTLPGVGNTYSEQKPLAGQTGRAQTMYSCFLFIPTYYFFIMSIQDKTYFCQDYLRCVKNAPLLNNPLLELVSDFAGRAEVA